MALKGPRHFRCAARVLADVVGGELNTPISQKVAAQVLRGLHARGWVLMSREPQIFHIVAMLKAMRHEGFIEGTHPQRQTEKHRLRLRAALAAEERVQGLAAQAHKEMAHG